MEHLEKEGIISSELYFNGNDGSGGQGKGPSINYVVSKLA